MNKITSLVIVVIALVVVGYVIIDHFNTMEQDANQQRLDEYLANQGLDPREEEEYVESDEYGPYKGMMAPTFSLPSWDDSKDIYLRDYEGSFVIINAWASWCPPCRDEIPYLIEFHENYLDDENVHVLGVNITTTEANVSSAVTFINDFNISYDIVMDHDGFVERNYRIFSLPMTFVVDPDGRIVIRKTGFMDYDMIVDIYEEAMEIYEKTPS
ncbi:MAG: TlpA family protein disulfide reductase [Bacillus sp. (in: Bacteria)]|nr:TlpA family protein disulfide reductase [Bacillus sp. (in: firmicutes)]